MSAPPPIYTDRQGGEHKTTPFHWYHPQRGAVARLVICPVCGVGPCDPTCAEQARPAPPKIHRDASVSRPLIGNGDASDLVRRAFAEAAVLKRAQREEAELP